MEADPQKLRVKGETGMGKISLQMYTLRAYTGTAAALEETLEKLRAIGFSTVQYSVPAAFDGKTVRDIFRRTGMENDSVFCPALALKARMRDVLGQCDLFGTEYIRTDSIPRGLTSDAAGYEMFAHWLNEAAGPYKRAGKKILYHFHTFEFIRFGNETGVDILLRETDPEAVQIIPDTHWIHCGGTSPAAFLTRYRGRYDYVHVKDYAIGPMGEQLEARPVRFAPAGEGSLDWPGILRVCRDAGVKSYAIEQDDTYGRDPFDCVRASFAFLRAAGVTA